MSKREALASGEAFAWLESPDGIRVFRGLAGAKSISGTDDLEAVLGTPGISRVIALDYELGQRLEPAAGPPTDGVAGMAWRFARVEQIALDEAGAAFERLMSGLPADAREAAVADIEPGWDEAAYRERFERVRRYIDAGDCYQVNLAFVLRMKTIGHPLALFRALRERQRAPWAACIVTPQRRLLSLSPELFVRREGSRIECRPMKGTRPRDGDPSADARLRMELEASVKDRAENVMIVDLLRNDLGRVAQPGSVRVGSLFEVESYPTVHQMVSSITAEAPGASAAAILAALFPSGSITGAPKVRAMQIIGDLERRPRGIYTGSIGAIASDGDFNFNVAIRTLELAADGSAVMGVGSGIVADSDASSEYRECLLKAGFVSGHRAAFRLIETMRLESGRIARLESHLRRLTESAIRLRFRLPIDDLRRQLAQCAGIHSGGSHRVRLTLSADGDFDVSVGVLDPLPPAAKFRVAAARLSSTDWGLRFKTTRRALYDEVLRSLQETPDVFDVVFCNERGELCEGARSNLFIHRGDRLLTPALECGLLPGVLRAELIARGEAEEAVLSLDDLGAADAVYLGNALRGLVPVKYDGSAAQSLSSD